VVAGTAGDENDAAAATNGGDILTETTESDGLVDGIQTTSHGVHDGLGLLKDLLLHEVVELALHDLLELQFDGLDRTDVGGTVILGQAVDVQLALVDVSDVIILQVEDLLGVLDDGRGVGGQEELGGLGDAIVGQESPRLGAVQERLVRRSQEAGGGLLDGDILGGLLRRKSTLFREFHVHEIHLHLLRGAHANDQGRTLTGRDDLVGVVHRLEQQSKGALKLLNDCLGQDGEFNVWVLVVKVLGELGDALGIGLGLETEALALQERLQFLVVGDDTIVNNGELPVDVGSAEGKPLVIRFSPFSFVFIFLPLSFARLVEDQVGIMEKRETTYR